MAGPIYDAGYMRAMVYFGSVVAIFGIMMTSVCKQYWQFVLAQGVTIGIGAACLVLPSVAGMPAYFKKRTALATGIGAAGSSIGVFLLLILHNHLLMALFLKGESSTRLSSTVCNRVRFFGFLSCCRLFKILERIFF